MQITIDSVSYADDIWSGKPSRNASATQRNKNETVILLGSEGIDVFRWTVTIRRLCGVMSSVLATGSKGGWFKPGRGDGYLRAIKIRSTFPLEGK
jgi:hypothetical protein